MDWIEEKAERLRKWIQNLSFRKAMIAYIVIAAVIVFLLSYITMVVCYRFQNIIWNKYDSENGMHWSDWSVWSASHLLIDYFDNFTGNDQIVMKVLDIMRIWCPFFYSFTGVVIAILIFYDKRLKKPFHLLKEGTEAIRSSNLDFNMHYDSADEMGKLCESFEEMRTELIRDKEELWEMIENQKKLNAAFAHDLRTPLTVLKGYSDFLARYIPEGKVSEQKMVETLKLMSGHLERLEQFSRTMKGIRSMEERPLIEEKTSCGSIYREMREVIFALNQIGDINIILNCPEMESDNGTIYADRSIIMEVFENLLSNAIRYAAQKITVTAEYCISSREFVAAVKDDGSGFTEEELQNALLPYYKEHGREGEHFGIGLHICRVLCEKHGGQLNIANSIEGGAIATASFGCLSNV